MTCSFMFHRSSRWSAPSEKDNHLRHALLSLSANQAKGLQVLVELFSINRLE